MRKISTILLILILSGAGYTEIIRRSANLITEITTIRNNLPGSGSEGFVLPSEEDLLNWQKLMFFFIQADTSRVDSLIQAHFSFYQLYVFTDTGFENRMYYLLREKHPVSKGWGTYIINTVHRRELAIEMPHPWYDTNTYSEGTDIFRRTGAKFLLMAGTHRCADSTFSNCDGTTSACGGSNLPYPVSDMAHFTESVFQITHQEIINSNPETYTISVHGHSNSSCEDIFLSNGKFDGSWPLLYSLKNSLLASGGLTVAVAGDGTSVCSLIGSTNVQGRYSNGSTNPCSQEASATNGYFMHIEQTRLVRDNYLQYKKLIDALNAHIPEIPASRIEGPENTPERLYMIAYPNPFNNNISILLDQHVRNHVSLKIYDLRGVLIRVLHEGYLARGVYRYHMATSFLASGIYFCVLRSNESHQTIKLILVR